MGTQILRRVTAVPRERKILSAEDAPPIKPTTSSQGNTSSDQWKFLTTEQALEDVVFFANSFPTTASSGHAALHPSVTPWVWLGGSYPGVRGAFIRLRNPEVIFASWASSAPVHAQVDMASYYKAAERSLTRNCSADWVAVTKYVDAALGGENGSLSTDVKFELEFARLSGKGESSSERLEVALRAALTVVVVATGAERGGGYSGESEEGDCSRASG